MNIIQEAVYPLKALRIAKDLSQKELAEIIGATDISVHNWEHGKHKMSDRNRYKLAKFFEVRPEQII